MEDEGSSSNRGKQAAPEATEAAATSSTSTSSSESGKISALVRVVVPRLLLVVMKIVVRVEVMSK
jgi:hypothetical protein